MEVLLICHKVRGSCMGHGMGTSTGGWAIVTHDEKGQALPAFTDHAEASERLSLMKADTGMRWTYTDMSLLKMDVQ